MDELLQAHGIPTNAYAHAVTVTPELVDLQGVVSNHDIVRIFAETAMAHSISLGWGLEAYHAVGAWWMVRRHEVDYLQSAVAGDELVCYTWPCGFTKTRGQRTHVLLRPQDDVVIARGLNTWALIDIERRRPRRIPPEMAEAFDPAKWIDQERTST